MTVPSQTYKWGPYLGNGVRVSFPYLSGVFAGSDLVVIRRRPDGSEVLLQLGTHYSVTGVGAPEGGTVEIAAAPPTGDTVWIIRRPPLVQNTDLVNQGPFYAEVLEAQFDRLVQQDQWIAGEVDRALKLAVTDVPGSGVYQAGGNRIGGLAPAQKPDEAVTLAQLAGGGVLPPPPPPPPPPASGALILDIIDGAIEVDCDYEHFELTLTEDVDAVTFTNVPPTHVALIDVIQAGAGGHTITWPASVVPVIEEYVPSPDAGDVDIVGLKTINGGTRWRLIASNGGSGGETPDVNTYIGRFNFVYDLLKDTANGYFGPTSGPDAYRVPYHAKERAVIVEAPDWTHESVSETVSFWVKMEAWKYLVSGSATGLLAAWQSINDIWIPDAQGQPWGDYDWEFKASSIVPDAETLEDTPVNSLSSPAAGADPLYNVLRAAYGTDACYLMHWLIDVDGDYGYKNPDGGTKNVFINNYQRGPVEDGMATITHPCYDDFENGGHPEYGWQPIYGREAPVYPDATSPYGYSKQASYSMAGDADVRAVGNAFLAIRHAPAGVPSAVKAMAAKSGAYIQYTLFDKHFRPVPGGYGADGCHYLLSWGCGYGVGLPVDGNDSYWGFRIGNSEIHHGYNGIDVAYACRTGGELASTATGVPARWAVSLDRQLELLRWCQSPEGPIAGGVTSNWRGRYETPTDGREDATFYGCYYNYSPSWFNPPSNNWSGFQAWGLQRVTEVAIHAAQKGSAENDIYHRCMVIMDKFIPWFVENCDVDLSGNTLAYPINTSWVSLSPIAGVTASEPSAKYVGLPENPSVAGPDVYEYLPTLEWPGADPDYEAFWSGDGTVPNPNLHCTITETGWDPGTAAGFAQVLLQYCYAKKVKGGGTLSGTVPNTSITLQSVLQLALDIMEFVWANKDADGFGSPGSLAIPRLNDILWIPPEFGTGETATGEVLENGETTFWSMRETMYMSSPQGPALKAWLESDQTGPAPAVTYHRFWNAADVAVAYAMIHHYFTDAVPPVVDPVDPDPDPEPEPDPDPGDGWEAVAFPGRRLALIGDSITEYTTQYFPPDPARNNRYGYYSLSMCGFWTYADQILGGRLELETGLQPDADARNAGYNFAVAGSRTSQWWNATINPQGTEAAGPMYAANQHADAFDVAVILGGTNDLSGNLSAASILDRLKQAASELAAAGKWVFIQTLTPRTRDLLSGYSLAQQDAIRDTRLKQINQGLRDWIATDEPPNVWLVDHFDDLVGPNGVDPAGLLSSSSDPEAASTLGNYRDDAPGAIMFHDGLHPGAAGAYVMGKKLAEVMIAAGVPARASATTLGPLTLGANLLPNPTFAITNTDTSASGTFNATYAGWATGLGAHQVTPVGSLHNGYLYGQVPDHWLFFRSNNAENESIGLTPSGAGTYSNFMDFTFGGFVGTYPTLADYMGNSTWPDGSVEVEIITHEGVPAFKIEVNIPETGNKNESFVLLTHVPQGVHGAWDNYGYNSPDAGPVRENTAYAAGDILQSEMDVVLSDLNGTMHSCRLALNILGVNQSDYTTTGAKISGLGNAHNFWPPSDLDRVRFHPEDRAMKLRTPAVTVPAYVTGETQRYAQLKLEVGMDASEGPATATLIIKSPSVRKVTGGTPL